MAQRRVTETFVGTSEAGEILGIEPVGDPPVANYGNVARILRQHGVPYQSLVVGKREMKVYLRDDVERVVRERRAKAKAKARAKKKAAAA